MMLFWKIDGDTFFTDYWESLPAVYGERLTASLGTEDGFSGVLTEFGIHVRDETGRPASEGDRFAFFTDAQNSLLIAEGFEDDTVSPNIKYSAPVRVRNGALALPPDTSIRFPSGGGGELAIRKLLRDDRAVLNRVDALSGEVLDSVPIDGKYYSISPYRISILLEKTGLMSDNGTEVIYELMTSDQNESDLQLEHILVNRE
jgi:hypothetical protein